MGEQPSDLPPPPRTSKRTAGAPRIFLGTSNTAMKLQRPADSSLPVGWARPLLPKGLRRGEEHVGPPRWKCWLDELRASGAGGPPTPNPMAAWKPIPCASVSWSEKWDQHVQVKGVSSRKPEMKLPTPSWPPESGGSIRTFLGACNPAPHHAPLAKTPLLPCLAPKPSHRPSESTFWGSAPRGTELGVSGWRCVGGALWLEAKAILVGSGLSAQLQAFLGPGVGRGPAQGHPIKQLCSHLPRSPL